MQKLRCRVVYCRTWLCLLRPMQPRDLCVRFWVYHMSGLPLFHHFSHWRDRLHPRPVPQLHWFSVYQMLWCLCAMQGWILRKWNNQVPGMWSQHIFSKPGHEIRCRLCPVPIWPNHPTPRHRARRVQGLRERKQTPSRQRRQHSHSRSHVSVDVQRWI